MKGKATRRNSWQEKGSTYIILHLFCTRGRNQIFILWIYRNKILPKVFIISLPNWVSKVLYSLCQMCLQDHSWPLSTKILQNNVIIKNYNAHFWEISNMSLSLYYLLVPTYVDCVKNRTQKSWRWLTQTMETFTFVVSCPQDTKSTCTILLFGLVAFPNSLWNIL